MVPVFLHRLYFHLRCEKIGSANWLAVSSLFNAVYQMGDTIRMEEMLAKLREQAAAQTIRVTQHAQEEMDAEEPEMKCSIEGCLGEYEQREVVHTIRQGSRIIVIDHVRAEVCTLCGDVLFTPETVRLIERLRHTALPPERTVPLYDFTQAKSA